MHEDLSDSQRLFAWWAPRIKQPPNKISNLLLGSVFSMLTLILFSLPNCESEFEWFTHLRSRWAMETRESVLIFLSVLMASLPPTTFLHLMFKWLSMSSYGLDSEVTSSHEWKTALCFLLLMHWSLRPGGNVDWYPDAKGKRNKWGLFVLAYGTKFFQHLKHLHESRLPYDLSPSLSAVGWYKMFLLDCMQVPVHKLVVATSCQALLSVASPKHRFLRGNIHKLCLKMNDSILNLFIIVNTTKLFWKALSIHVYIL